MTPRLTLLLSLTIPAVLSQASAAADTVAEKPHIVLVMSDDQGWGDTGYNGHPFVQTPSLDAMAKSALVFDRFYAAAPVCSPTRASVLTGRSPIRCKVPNHGRYMRPHEQTIAESLKAGGYVTGIFGKVHLGSGQAHSACNPTGMGFDEWVIGLNFFDNNPYLSRNGIVEQRQGKGTVITIDDTLAFLEKHKDGVKPMFAVAWFPSPHDPHVETPENRQLYQGKPQAGYYREITLMDQQVGRLRKQLRELKIAENTILLFCSDNGGLNPDTSGGRAKKGSIYEGGLRVPALMEWPLRQLRGRIAAPVSTSDIYPTLMAMAGIEWSPAHPLDGIDISPILAGELKQRPRPIGFWHLFQNGQATYSDRTLAAIMKKQQAGAPEPHDPPRMHKDVYDFPQFEENKATGHAAWNDWPWKLHQINGSEYQLYHLENDPSESKDLSRDPQHAERLRNMQDELHQWMRSVVRSINGEDYSATEMKRN